MLGVLVMQTLVLVAWFHVCYKELLETGLSRAGADDVAPGRTRDPSLEACGISVEKTG